MMTNDDAQLVAWVLAGDKDAFSQLVARHWLRVRRLLLAAFPAADDADDWVQEAFLEAYLNIDKLRDPARFGSWVCGIGLNLARMQQRRQRPFRWHSWDSMVGELADKRPLPDQQLEQREWEQRLHQAVASLPAAERDAILLVYESGLSQKETAVSLGISPGAVKVRVHRGRRHLYQTLVDAQEAIMVTVVVKDVVRMMPEPDQEHAVVLLQEAGGERLLPIWIGSHEADWIALQLQQKEWKRPLSFDLMKALLDVGGMQVKRALVTKLHEEVFYGTLEVRKQNGELAEVDCRPSDAITLALRVQAPILVAAEIMDSSATTFDELQQKSVAELVSILKS